MDKVIKLAVLIIGLALLYFFTPFGGMVDKRIASYKAGRAEAAYREAAKKVDKRADEKEEMRKKGRWGTPAIPDVPLVDEDGDRVWTGDIINEYPDNILVIHVIATSRGHCPRGDDKPHFRAVMDLQENYYDDIYLVGFNWDGSRKKIRKEKDYYGLYYGVYSKPDQLVVDSKEEAEDWQKFMDVFHDDEHVTCVPSVVYVKDGVVRKIVRGLSSYDEIEAALKEVMET